MARARLIPLSLKLFVRHRLPKLRCCSYSYAVSFARVRNNTSPTRRRLRHHRLRVHRRAVMPGRRYAPDGRRRNRSHLIVGATEDAQAPRQPTNNVEQVNKPRIQALKLAEQMASARMIEFVGQHLGCTHYFRRWYHPDACHYRTVL